MPVVEELLAQTPAYISMTVYSVLAVVGIIMIVGIAVYIMFLASFKHRVIVRRLVNKRVVIQEDKARTYKDKKGVVWWQRLKEPNKQLKLIEMPPSRAIDIDTKGRYFIEVYLTESGHYVFLEDKVNAAELPADIFLNVPLSITQNEDENLREQLIQTWKDEQIDKWKADHSVSEAFHPFTTEQRVLTVNNIKDAEERRGKSIWENLPQLAALGMIVIVVICLMIFWGDIAAPVIEAKKISTVQLEIMNEISKTQQDINYGIQRIESEQATLTDRVGAVEQATGVKTPN